LPNPTLALQLAHDLVSCGLKVELDNTKAFPSPDFSSRCPKIYTHDQAQCLNFETIVIPRLTRSAYLGYSDDEIVNLLTDAANRATKWFYLSSSLPAALCNLDQFNRVSESVKIGKTPDPITAKKPVFKKPLVITPIDDLL
jgi:hypothetical protein